MRRREWGAIVAGFALVAFTACGGGNKNETAAADSAAAPAATTPPAAAPAPAGPTMGGTPPAGATPEMVAEGQKTFATVCFTCHGQDAKGTQLAPNLTDSEWLNVGGTYDEIQKLVKTGVPQPKKAPAPMPPMGGAQLTDDQIKAVSAYVWSLGGGK